MGDHHPYLIGHKAQVTQVCMERGEREGEGREGRKEGGKKEICRVQTSFG